MERDSFDEQNHQDEKERAAGRDGLRFGAHGDFSRQYLSETPVPVGEEESSDAAERVIPE